MSTNPTTRIEQADSLRQTATPEGPPSTRVLMPQEPEEATGGGAAAASGPSAPRTSAVAGRIEELDGQQFKEMMWAGYAWLEQHKEVVNLLNVFPVPDGDTGTNMVLTMKAAWNEINESAEDDVGRMAQAVAQGALMGARGNSGVILSQILRGLAHVFRHKPSITAQDLVVGLRRGSETAYKGVVKPVEGTILTVIREAADAGQRALAVDKDMEFVLSRTVQAARESVERTPSLLPVLAKAGVVDSGGKGLSLILEGMLQGFRGQAVEPQPLSMDGIGPVLAGPIEIVAGTERLDPYNLPQLRYGFDVQFLIWGRNLDVTAIRDHVVEMGECPLVEGNSTLVKVHVHVPDPSKPLAYGLSQGFLTDIVVENMDAMVAAGRFPDDVNGSDQGPADVPAVVAAPEEVPSAIGVIAVVPGHGLREVFESLGVGAVVSGGQTMNPSTQELLQAIEALPNEGVVVLPNNSNVILAAQQAQQLAHKQVEVVPTRTVPQGISALLAVNMQASLEENVAAMERAMTEIDTGEVTVAVRAASVDGIDVRPGDVIGLLNDTLTTKGETPEQVVLLLLGQMDAHLAEIITVYYGDQIEPAQAEALGAEIGAIYADQDVEVLAGGQPHYHYIVSSE